MNHRGQDDSAMGGPLHRSASKHGPTPSVKYKLLTTREELDELAPEWNELLHRSASNNVFLTWEWISIWWEYFGGNRQPWVLTARESHEEKLVGLVPLAKEELVSRRGLRYGVLTFLGSGRPAPDHLDVVVDAKYGQTLAAMLVQELGRVRAGWDILCLRGLTSDSMLTGLLHGRSGYRQLSEEVCPYIELPADWETYRNSLNRKKRFNIGYAARRLEKLYPGKLHCRQVERQEELESALDSLFRMHTELRQARGEAGAFADNRMRDFHRHVAAQFLKNGWLRFYQLRVGDKEIAVLYCYHYNNVVSFYQSGYDQSWKEHSPGSQIIAHAIRQAIEEGAKEFDFLRGAEAYKFDWTSTSRKDLDVEFTPSILRRVHNLYLDVNRLVRSVNQRIVHAPRVQAR